MHRDAGGAQWNWFDNGPFELPMHMWGLPLFAYTEDPWMNGCRNVSLPKITAFDSGTREN